MDEKASRYVHMKQISGGQRKKEDSFIKLSYYYLAFLIFTHANQHTL